MEIVDCLREQIVDAVSRRLRMDTIGTSQNRTLRWSRSNIDSGTKDGEACQTRRAAAEKAQSPIVNLGDHLQRRCAEMV